MSTCPKESPIEMENIHSGVSEALYRRTIKLQLEYEYSPKLLHAGHQAYSGRCSRCRCYLEAIATWYSINFLQDDVRSQILPLLFLISKADMSDRSESKVSSKRSKTRTEPVVSVMICVIYAS